MRVFRDGETLLWGEGGGGAWEILFYKMISI